MTSELYLPDIGGDAMAEIRRLSRKRIYQTDPEAWLWDVLGKKWWSKQQEIGHNVADPQRLQTQTIVKSCNGIGKSAIAGDLVSWFVAVNDPADTSVLLSAPIFKQVKTVLFRYLADNWGIAAARKMDLPGYITGEPALKVARIDGNMPKEVVQAKRPADTNLISSFQGIHDRNVMVILDEAGGLPEDLYIGANAVTTNEHVRILAIGNPDDIGTPFHARFLNEGDRYRDWDRFSVSAYDSPNFTGEVIHPEDLARDKSIKSLMVQQSWAEMMIRQAHPSVVAAKVYGEFPKDADNAFFPQSTVNIAYENEIDPSEETRGVLGVDLAFEGEDVSTCYMNRDGHIRFVDKWVKETNYMTAARRIHQAALSSGAQYVVVDAAGAGGGAFSNLDTQPEFENKPYLLVGVKGSYASPDRARWANARAWHYDSFREMMQQGVLDLDNEDKALRDEMLRQTFKINERGQLHPTPKTEMRKAGMKSPDYLDAAIYSAIPIETLFGTGITANLNPGDRIAFDPFSWTGGNLDNPNFPV